MSKNSEAFDPNKETAKGLWATYIPGRRPRFKIHASQSHATSAVKCQSIYSGRFYLVAPGIKLYKRVNEGAEWQAVTLRQTYRDGESVLAKTGESE